MTDLAAEGSVQAGTPEAATGAVLGTEGSKPENAAVDPFTGLDTDTRSWVDAKGIKDLASAVQVARNAEKLVGRAVVLPGEDGKPEDWDKVWSKLGKPETKDGYELTPPETMPESLPYNQDFAEWFKGAAHEAGLPKQMAKALHDKFVGMSVETATKNAQATVDKANADLSKAWGAAGSDTYKANLAFADRGIKTLGGDALVSSLKSAGLLGPNGEVLDANIAVAFAKAGKELASEGQFITGGSTGGADNPFLDGQENLTKQMILYKQDPNRAMAMIRAAGKRPSDFGIPG